MQPSSRSSNSSVKGALALALGLGCAGSAQATTNTGTIYGWVFSQSSHSAVCRLTVRTHSNREPDWQTVTARNGWFTFLSVLPGPVWVSVGPGLETRLIEVHANLPTQTIFYVRARSHGCGSRS